MTKSLSLQFQGRRYPTWIIFTTVPRSKTRSRRRRSLIIRLTQMTRHLMRYQCDRKLTSSTSNSSKRCSRASSSRWALLSSLARRAGSASPATRHSSAGPRSSNPTTSTQIWSPRSPLANPTKCCVGARSLMSPSSWSSHRQKAHRINWTA